MGAKATSPTYTASHLGCRDVSISQPTPLMKGVPPSRVNQEQGLWEACAHQLGGWEGFLEMM